MVRKGKEEGIELTLSDLLVNGSNPCSFYGILIVVPILLSEIVHVVREEIGFDKIAELGGVEETSMK
jgi:hypothetical protein